MKIKIQEISLEWVDSIPPPLLPQVLMRFLALLDDDRTPLAEVASLASQDPALAAHLLTLANSPPFRRGPAARSLDSALAAIGPPMLRTLASSLAARNAFAPLDETSFDYTGFWRHSLLVARLARSLAVAIDYPDAEEAYLAGLLHDIGQVLVVAATEGYPLPGSGHGPDAYDHAVAGARLVEEWNLSSFMADAILFHRHPVEEIASADLLSRIVWSAHKLSGCDTEEELRSCAWDIAAIRSLVGIDAARIPEIWKHSRDGVNHSAASLGIDLSSAGPVSPDSSFIAREASSRHSRDKDPARVHLEAHVRTMAVMQPLQQSLLSLPDEDSVCRAVCESARILFGLGRPVFLVVHPDKPVLTGAKMDGQSDLLTRLEIQLDSPHSFVASALRENRPTSSHDGDRPQSPSLSDIQICRIVGAEGILCVPMCNGENPVGVMVYGLPAERHAQTVRRRESMASFASGAARTLESLRMLRDRDRAIGAELARQYEQSSRKVVHEVVNPLGIINNYLNIVSGKLGEENGVGRELVILKEEIARVERIIRGMGDTGNRPPEVETVNVNGVIEGMLALYGDSLFDARGIAVESGLAPELPAARGDRDSLKQILLNIWKNSAEAMPGGGRLNVATRLAAEGERGTIEIHLSDTGPGIPADVMERLFQPLDPDRRPANSGVGLSIVASLVEKLGGTITCQSSPETGTGFTIGLPRA